MWQELKAKYKKMMTALKNHNSGRNTAPQNVDYNFIDAIHPGKKFFVIRELRNFHITKNNSQTVK